MWRQMSNIEIPFSFIIGGIFTKMRITENEN